MGFAVMATIPAVCARPACRTTFTPGASGRPRLYCSPECTKAATNERRAAERRVAHLEQQLTRERHYLAAFAAFAKGVDR